MSAVIIAAIFAFSAPAAADWTYDGYEVKTMTSGIIPGDVYVDGGHGAPTYGWPNNDENPYNETFEVPSGSSVKWARLYVGVWGGKEMKCGWLNTTLNNTEKGLQCLGNVTIGNVSTLATADDDNPTYDETVPSVYGSGHGCWLVAYNVTSNVSQGETNIVNATTDRIYPTDFDGRVYGIVLVVVYENTSLPKIQYWVNEGNVNLHYNMSSAPYNYVLDNTTTWFNGTAYNSTEAKIWVEYLAGSDGEPDYLYFNPSNAVRTDMNWTISTNRTWQLDGGDVANESSHKDPGTYGWDLHNFTSTNDSTPLKEIVNKTANNSAFFWRGHDNNNDGWIYAEFNGGTSEEGEDYLHPAVAVLILKNITHVYDFSDNFSGTPGEDAWAFEKEVSAKPPTSNGVPNDEFSSDDDYNKIKTDNEDYKQSDSATNGYYAAHRFNFSIDETAPDKINVTWNGKGWHDNGTSYNGTQLYIWNGTAYEELDNTTSGADVTLTGENASAASNYVNGGNVTVLVVQNSADHTDEDPEHSHIATDYIKLVVTPDP